MYGTPSSHPTHSNNKLIFIFVVLLNVNCMLLFFFIHCVHLPVMH